MSPSHHSALDFIRWINTLDRLTPVEQRDYCRMAAMAALESRSVDNVRRDAESVQREREMQPVG